MITLTPDQLEWVAMGVQVALEQEFGVRPESWPRMPPEKQDAFRKAAQRIVDDINDQIDPECDGMTVLEFYAVIDGATA